MLWTQGAVLRTSLIALRGSSCPFIWIKGLLRYFNSLTPLKSFDSVYPVMRFIIGEGNFVNNRSFVKVGFEDLQCQAYRVPEWGQCEIDCIRKSFLMSENCWAEGRISVGENRDFKWKLITYYILWVTLFFVESEEEVWIGVKLLYGRD
jgi:hypothetical protein